MAHGAIAARHAYLGALEEVAHLQPLYYRDGEVVTLPLMFLRDIVLFPGDELPLRMLSGMDEHAIREHLASEGAMLAVLCAGQGDAAFGTTVRVERFGLVDQQASLTGVAKQRFQLKATRRARDGLGVLGDVKILADLQPLPPPFARPHVKRDYSSVLTRKRKMPRYPSYWGYEQYALFDAHLLVRRLQQTMVSSAHARWFEGISATSQLDGGALVHYLTDSSDIQDPVRFAYWLAANLPLKQEQRLELLGINGVVALLRREIAILEDMEEHIHCSRCSNFLAHTRDMFSMLDESPAGTFVNPHGFVYQIMTLRHVETEHILVETSRSTQDSWFPGFAWSISYCRRCDNHLGWRFDRVQEGLSPEFFFGFRRGALSQRRTSQPPDEAYQPERYVLVELDDSDDGDPEESDVDEAESFDSD